MRKNDTYLASKSLLRVGTAQCFEDWRRWLLKVGGGDAEEGYIVRPARWGFGRGQLRH